MTFENEAQATDAAAFFGVRRTAPYLGRRSPKASHPSLDHATLLQRLERTPKEQAFPGRRSKLGETHQFDNYLLRL